MAYIKADELGERLGGLKPRLVLQLWRGGAFPANAVVRLSRKVILFNEERISEWLASGGNASRGLRR